MGYCSPVKWCWEQKDSNDTRFIVMILYLSAISGVLLNLKFSLGYVCLCFTTIASITLFHCIAGPHSRRRLIIYTGLLLASFVAHRLVEGPISHEMCITTYKSSPLIDGSLNRSSLVLYDQVKSCEKVELFSTSVKTVPPEPEFDCSQYIRAADMFTMHKEAIKSFATLLPFFNVEDNDIDQFVSFMDSGSSDSFFRHYLKNRKHWAEEFKKYRLERRYDSKVSGGGERAIRYTSSFKDTAENFRGERSPDGPHHTSPYVLAAKCRNHLS